ncbi:ankyrin repeat domain-containing protein [Flavobacteriaceae bacterium XHP0103]|uniref:ankyrin repeat domain-containing protein n=1 Tax=Marixanthotalea marina TaxID=2844359 RepID=UPI002989C580|nr:ankyrin repeat domain-containing protein [Marixanthotalea marina]MBU3822224.1 ankyrin repeat domain-containing protein [Marixanthotalea marina]
MKKSIKIQVKHLAIICTIAISLKSCFQKNETKKTTAISEKKIAKPSQDIHEAIIMNNFEVVKRHIEEGSDINKIEAMSGSTPLLTAVTFNRPKIVAELLKVKVDLSIKNNDGSTVLHTAAFFGRIEMVKMLLDAGADKTIKNNFGATPRETVLGDFSEIKPFYEMLIKQLQPMGFTLDLAEVEKARPVIAMMLQ